jgi:hypothetical protein
MDKSTMVSQVNEKLRPKLGYNPYILKNNKILCSCCRKDVSSSTKETLMKTKVVKDSNGDPHDVHICSGCKYLQGINVSLKKRISEVRKELGLHEFPANNKLKNAYFIPQHIYNFIDPINEENIQISEDELYDRLYNSRKEKLNSKESVKEETTKTEKEEVSTESEEKGTSDKENISESDNIVEESESDIFDDDNDDLSDIFSSDDESEESNDESDEETKESNDESDEETKESSDESDKETKESSDESEESNDESDKSIEDNIDDFFNNITLEEESYKKETSKKYDQINKSGGATNFNIKKDKNIEDMIKENAKYEEDEVFNIEDRKDHVYDIVKRSRIFDLTESFNDSNAKIVIDRILRLFEKRAKKELQHKIYINDITHEYPVVDFEGNVRLIFVDLEIPSGKENVEAEINSKLKPSFPKSSERKLTTFVIYSDMIVTSYINNVVRAVSKHIAFNLKIKGVFNPISIIKDSDQYFYTTAKKDKIAISRFDMANTPGNEDKPCTGEIALVSKWINPKVDNTWLYRKELSNRAAIARGDNVDYEDLSMFMTCSMKYILIPPKPDGTLNITIVDYVESLDLYVKDGFGALIGVLLYNAKVTYPQSSIHLYYELDVTTIPSPTITRYLKNGYIRPVNINPEIKNLNNIIDIVSHQNYSKVPKIPTEGEPFDSPEYNSNFWKTYVLSPEYRRSIHDGKRKDWRRFGRKMFSKTLGEQFDRFKSANINDRKVRNTILEKLGYQTVIQPQVIKTKIDTNFGRTALGVVTTTCSGYFSISEYVDSNKSTIVDDYYMNSGNQTPNYGVNQQFNNPTMNIFQMPQWKSKYQ